MDATVNIPWELMEHFVPDAFQAAGLPRRDAELCADVLLEADRRGIATHGCNRLKPIYIDRILAGQQKPVTEIEVLKDTPTTLVLDAHNGMGMVASRYMMEQLIRKAKTCGMAGGSITHSTHYGIAGYWATMASAAGLIGITGTNARPSIAPTFGVENMMGTNPLSFAFPTDEEFPFCLDCATSIIQRGKVEKAVREGKPVPPGLVVGENGQTMTDSKAILDALIRGSAALAPLGGIGEETGGYKGYGLAAVVEILSAALCGGPFMKGLNGRKADGSPDEFRLSHFFLVLDPEAFMGLGTFKKTAGDICRSLRTSKKAPGQERIYTAGEKEWLTWQARKDTGLPIGEAGQKDFAALRDRFGLPYHFPFEA